jgi:hypothetical protein
VKSDGFDSDKNHFENSPNVRIGKKIFIKSRAQKRFWLEQSIAILIENILLFKIEYNREYFVKQIKT